MCHNKQENDNYAAYQISSLMKNRNVYHIADDHEAIQFRANSVGSYSNVITQRYHGIVLSEIMNVPVLPIYHHDKLIVPDALPYYEISKNRLIDSFLKLKEQHISANYISINFSAFDQLKQKVQDILK